MIGIMLFAAAAAVDVSAKAAVVDTENGWEKAEVTGDDAFLDRLLAPDYVSVGSDGSIHDKERIKAGARRYAAQNPGAKPIMMGPTSTVDVYGDMALVHHHHGTDSISVDVFQLRDGHWVAVYSQHTMISAPAAAHS